MTVTVFLIGFPFLAETVWSRTTSSPDHVVGEIAGACLSLIWCACVLRIAASTVQLVRGRSALFAGGAIVWIASIVAVIITSWSPTMVTSAVRSSPVAAVTTVGRVVEPAPVGHGAPSPYRWTDHESSDAPSDPPSDPPSEVVRDLPRSHASSHDATPELSAGAASGLPLALVAKRRRDFLTQTRLEPPEDDVDEWIDSLRGFDEREIALVRFVIGDQSSGRVRIPHDAPRDRDAPLDVPTVAVLVVADDVESVVAFAQPGHALALGSAAAALVERTAAVVSHRGRCHVAGTPEAALRALALRPDASDVVVYLGPATDLDEEIALRCVTIADASDEEDNQSGDKTWNFAHLAVTPPRPIATPAATSRADVRVHLLRAEPSVSGLAEPFIATLRRRCVEMTAYLAVHAGEPVTGERLRARVLGRGDDASVRTLANTASAVRRSLGADGAGPRLHPVSPAGLYQVHGVSCDLVEFHRLIASARDPRATNAPDALRRALDLIDGEPLATALRGFEWFLAEGHLARLQRAGEWAALALAAAARDDGDVDLAFWAIEQGRLIDPYSDALEAALHRVPRQRHFPVTTARDSEAASGSL